MKVAIVGSRTFPHLSKVVDLVKALPAGTVVVSGGARGVDFTAETAAKDAGLDIEIYPADWKGKGAAAGMIRNWSIIRAADRVVAFWDGSSTGTKHSIHIAKSLRKPLEVILANPVQVRDTILFQELT